MYSFCVHCRHSPELCIQFLAVKQIYTNFSSLFQWKHCNKQKKSRISSAEISIHIDRRKPWNNYVHFYVKHLFRRFVPHFVFKEICFVGFVSFLNSLKFEGLSSVPSPPSLNFHTYKVNSRHSNLSICLPVDCRRNEKHERTQCQYWSNTDG